MFLGFACSTRQLRVTKAERETDALLFISATKQVELLNADILPETSLRKFKVLATWADEWQRRDVEKLVAGEQVPTAATIKRFLALCPSIALLQDLVTDEEAAAFALCETWVREQLQSKLAELLRSQLDEPLSLLNKAINCGIEFVGSFKGETDKAAAQEAAAAFKKLCEGWDPLLAKVRSAVDGDATQVVEFAGRFKTTVAEICDFAERVSFDFANIPVKVEVGSSMACLSRWGTSLTAWSKGIGDDPGGLPTGILQCNIEKELASVTSVLSTLETSFLVSWNKTLAKCCKVGGGLSLCGAYLQGPPFYFRPTDFVISPANHSPQAPRFRKLRLTVSYRFRAQAARVNWHLCSRGCRIACRLKSCWTRRLR